MSQADMLSINAVAAKLGLSVHQLRRWELMFGLEIKRGRGQQRQYRSEDMSVLERIKELVEQGWPTSQIRPQLEAEGLVTPKLIGLPPPPGNPEVLSEALIGFRNFTERRFIEISRQIDELRQLLISITLKQELQGETTSPWQPVQREFAPEPKPMPAQEISIGPDYSAGPPVEFTPPPPPPPPPQRTSIIGAPATPKESTFEVGPASAPFPGASSGSSFGSTPAAPERRSIIGEPNAAAPPPPPPPPAAPTLPSAPSAPSVGMSEEEADALLEEEDELEEEVLDESTETAPSLEVKELLDEIDAQEKPGDEDEEEDEEEPISPPAPTPAPTITPVSSASGSAGLISPSSSPSSMSAGLSAGAPSVTTSGSFSAVSSEAPSAPPPPPPSPAADPFKSTPFMPSPSASVPSGAPRPAEPPSNFSPSTPPSAPPSPGPADDMFSSVIQSASDAAAREADVPKPQEPPAAPAYGSSFADAPPPPVPPTGGTPFNPPASDSSPFIPTPSSSSSSPFLTPPPAPYMTGPGSDSSPMGGALTPPPQPLAPPVSAAPAEPEAPPAPPEPPKAPAAPVQKGPFLGEITDQNYLTILGRALDLVGWSDEQADSFSVNRFKVPHWDELGRSQAEVLIEHLLNELQTQMNAES